MPLLEVCRGQHADGGLDPDGQELDGGCPVVPPDMDTAAAVRELIGC